MGVKLKGYILAIISSVSYGLIPLFMIPLKADSIPLDTILFNRFTISAFFVGVYLLIRKEGFRISMKELIVFAILGVLFALSAEFLFIGYDYASPGIASTILFVFPVIVALIMVVFFKEKIAAGTLIALLVTISGVFALGSKESFLDIHPLGVTFSLLSALAYALYIVVVNKSNIQTSGFKITFYSLLFSAIFYFLKTSFSGHSLFITDSTHLSIIAIFGLITTVVSTTALVLAIKLIGSTPTSILGAMEPIMAVSISVVMFHEKITAGLIIGIVLILTGAIINIVADSRKKDLNLQNKYPL